ncbi:MAG: GNAT family N-acetyltransferase [Myxococcota bacterium]
MYDYDSSWKQRYQSRVTSAAAAIRKILPGRRILIGSGAAEPTTLVEALVRDGTHLSDNEIVHLLTLGPAPYVQPEFAGRFRHSAFFIGRNTREAVQTGRADFIPVFLSEIPKLIACRRVRVDVVLVQVSPPDRHGYVSLGVSVDVVRAAVAAADLVIAEVNPCMPRTLGESQIPVSELDWMIPVESPILELVPESPDATCLEIGRHVASLIPDGATLQTGIGKIPHAVVTALSNHHDLGVHTEMLSDTVLDLVEAGVINGRKKTLLPGKIVTSFVMGTQRIYKWIDDNPSVEMRPSDFTNDPFVVAQNDRMVAINSALAVDLTGQVAADTVGGRFFSGIGGQVDFIRGAARSRGGKPIIALPSTAKNGSVSRIQAVLEPGAGVVTSRGDVHYVVTEYGIADLWGKNIRERATALTEIAHPDFRVDLINSAKKRHYVFPEQRVAHEQASAERATRVQLTTGEMVVIRPVRLADEGALQSLLYRLSDDSIHMRFHGYKKVHPRHEIAEQVNADPELCSVYVAELEGNESGDIIGLARYDLDRATRIGEVGLIVADAYQNKGLGTALFARLVAAARTRALAGLSAQVLSSNGRMLSVFNKSGLRVESQLDSGVYDVSMSFD